MKLRILGLITLFCFVLNGCATIMGSSHEVRFISKPEGADILLNSKKIGTTPMSMQRGERFDSYILSNGKCEKKTTSDMIEKSINPWIFGNIVLLPVCLFIPVCVADIISGKSYNTVEEIRADFSDCL